MIVPALRTVGNIVTGDDMQTQVIVNCSVLTCLLALLQSNHKKSIKKEACWTISNITAGTKEQIQAVIDAGIIGPLVHLLQTAEFDIKKEAAWAISNATSGGTHEQIKHLVEQGAIKPMCDLLVVNDSRIVTVALEGLENILKVVWFAVLVLCWAPYPICPFVVAEADYVILCNRLARASRSRAWPQTTHSRI